ncbi:MAG: glycoside hydrolase family 3 C-terminal domain-containing protein [Bacteroidales bacterium]|jgi:beta-glucosidase|nr:glycoside hydrolase family 3 C-terminal domain-containing protein [Bacteroidales bacterium]
MKNSLLILTTLLVVACSENTGLPVYKDASKPVEARVADLLKRMTLEEKTAQMQDLFMAPLSTDDVIDTAKVAELNGMSYCVLIGEGLSVEENARNIALFRQYMDSRNRLGIPVLCAAEALHGLMQKGATIFPQAIALGSTFNPELVNKAAHTIAAECKAAGINQVLSPDLDLARELRWGRVEETYGEDPYLAGRMGVAFVKAFNEHDIICTPKHYAAHGSPSGGLNLASVAGGNHDLYSIYLKPFSDVIRECQPYSIMNPYSSYDGVPVVSSKRFMDDILRGDLGFRGYVSSDWGSIGMLYSFHKTAADPADAARQAVLAGIDCEVGGGCYEHLNELVHSGQLSESDIDRCVERILRAKFAIGLFDRPNIPDMANLKKVIHTPEAVRLSLEVARESAVLLKNDKGLLPLQLGKIHSIAVIGPNADQIQFGGYSWTNDNAFGVTPLQGIQATTDGKIKINYAKGCEIHSQDKSGIAQAVDAARKSDVAVLFVGGRSNCPGLYVPTPTSGEGYDLSDITLTGAQEDLIKAVYATGKPVVLVLVAGKPSAIPWAKQHIPAIVVQWYAGEQQGTAIAEILFGKVNPSGKLNVSFPQSTGHLPVFYNHYPTDKGYYKNPGTPERPGQDYVFSSPDPLWAFGTGLSYTTFEYKNLRIKSDVLTKDETIDIEADITNSGTMDGKEVVQLYVRDEVSSVVTPVKELKRFEKLFIKAGETKTVRFELPVAELALYNAKLEKVVEPGEFTLQIGTASDNILLEKVIAVKD